VEDDEEGGRQQQDDEDRVVAARVAWHREVQLDGGGVTRRQFLNGFLNLREVSASPHPLLKNFPRRTVIYTGFSAYGKKSHALLNLASM
jgi:hypothetical protein